MTKGLWQCPYPSLCNIVSICSLCLWPDDKGLMTVSLPQSLCHSEYMFPVSVAWWQRVYDSVLTPVSVSQWVDCWWLPRPILVTLISKTLLLGFPILFSLQTTWHDFWKKQRTGIRNTCVCHQYSCYLFLWYYSLCYQYLYSVFCFTTVYIILC